VPGEIEQDRVATQLRAQITETDLGLLELVNRRIELVERLRNRKLEHGYPLIDESREDWLVAHLREANSGPLSDAGVRTLVEEVILLVRAELSDGTGGPPRS
jgi:chorismate mutase